MMNNWTSKHKPAVSVIMPTFLQSAFIRQAIDSLLDQRFQDWELMVINDGSPDDTEDTIKPYLVDERIRYYKFDQNRGLGAALNYGLGKAQAEFIAYLPSDDIYYRDHLSELYDLLTKRTDVFLAYSGVRHHYNRFSQGKISSTTLQLVQVMHRRSAHRWMEREELVTDDLDRMFWSQLHAGGNFAGTNSITCEWVEHPEQRSKQLKEPEGGINKYRQRYKVRVPLRFHTTVGNYIDEVEHYRRFRERPDTPVSKDGLKIVLAGELAYNPERVLALEERGHKLYGLWMPDPYWYNTVGQLPFGHVTDIPTENWVDAVKKIQPDVIYGLLNWQTVPFAHRIMNENPGIPFIWHFKEGPFICREKGTWKELVELYQFSDGQIYCSVEMQDWFETVIPGISNREYTLILDGDLPKKDWFTDKRSRLVSEGDGEIHTVVPGRPIGLHPQNVVELAENNIHLHFYGDFVHGQWLEWIEKTMRLAPGYIHLHRQVDQEDWVSEFSKYDAGWLHFFESKNKGEIRRSDWDDLNIPARLSTLISAGLPLLQRDNADSIVATQSLARTHNIGFFFKTMSELREQLKDENRTQKIRSNVWRLREEFTFDYHVDRLIQFFQKVIDRRTLRSHRNGSAFIFPLDTKREEKINEDLSASDISMADHDVIAGD